jgi:hypothetical protein
MAALILLAFFVVLGVAVLLGHVPDTRDPDFSLGKLLAPRRAPNDEGR